MSCEYPLQNVSLLVDGRLAPAEQASAMAHLRACRSCNAEYQEVRSLRDGLKQLHKPAIPAALAAKLRVVASHERERQIRRVSLAARYRFFVDRVRLSFDNMMRPVALPFAGGLLSALLMFGAVVPRLAFPYHFRDDVPTMMFTAPDGKVDDLTQNSNLWGANLNKHYYSDIMEIPRLEPMDAAIARDEESVVLTIDPSGKVVAWDGEQPPEELQGLILFSKFTPATLFGQPTWGKKQLVFRRVAAARS